MKLDAVDSAPVEYRFVLTGEACVLANGNRPELLVEILLCRCAAGDAGIGSSRAIRKPVAISLGPLSLLELFLGIAGTLGMKSLNRGCLPRDPFDASDPIRLGNSIAPTAFIKGKDGGRSDVRVGMDVASSSLSE